LAVVSEDKMMEIAAEAAKNEFKLSSSCSVQIFEQSLIPHSEN
jgi:hypothetical protein